MLYKNIIKFLDVIILMEHTSYCLVVIDKELKKYILQV